MIKSNHSRLFSKEKAHCTDDELRQARCGFLVL